MRATPGSATERSLCYGVGLSQRTCLPRCTDRCRRCSSSCRPSDQARRTSPLHAGANQRIAATSDTTSARSVHPPSRCTSQRSSKWQCRAAPAKRATSGSALLCPAERPLSSGARACGACGQRATRSRRRCARCPSDAGKRAAVALHPLARLSAERHDPQASARAERSRSYGVGRFSINAYLRLRRRGAVGYHQQQCLKRSCLRWVVRTRRNPS